MTPLLRSGRCLAVLLMGLGATCVTACGPAAESQDGARSLAPNLVLVSIDTLRADHVGAYGYFRDTTPVIDALAEQGLLFERAYSVMSMTLPSHTSLFTGRWPLEHGILGNLRDGGRLYAWSPDLLSFPEVLRAEGYRTAGFISAAPLKSPTGINVGFEHYDEPAGRERVGAETVALAGAWLEQQSAGQPFFLFVHLYDPHWPQLPIEPYASMFTGGDELDRWVTERGLPEAAVRAHSGKSFDTRETLNRYCGEVRYADAQVGVLFERLRELDLWEDSLVVVTSDHGDGLNQHGIPGHDGHVWEEQLRVPLVVRFPAALAVDLPRRHSGVTSLADLLPTLAARVPAWDTAGVRAFVSQASGVDVLAGSHERAGVLGQRTAHDLPDDPGSRFALTTDAWKFVHAPEGTDQLFDRAVDPHELSNAAVERATELGALRAELLELLREQSARGAALGSEGDGTRDEALLRQLQDLGYLGGD